MPEEFFSQLYNNKPKQHWFNMLIRVLILAGFCVLGGRCYFGFDNVRDNPFNPPQWNWNIFSDLHGAESQKSYAEDRMDDSAEDDREPLAPDYKDPKRPNDVMPKTKPPYIPDGVVDIDASEYDFPKLPDAFGISGFDDGNANSFFGLGGFFGPFAEPKRWWKGDNVCVEREETTDDEGDEPKQKDSEISVPNYFSTSISLSNCQETPSKYECVTKINNHGVAKTFVVRYKCCYGYKRSDDSSGCAKKVALVSLLNTIEDIGAMELKNMIISTGLEDKFNSDNLTMFVPTDEAMIRFTDKMTEMNQVDLDVPEAVRRRRQIKNPLSSKDLVLSHAIPGFLDVSEINNEDVLKTAFNSKIRFNLYPTRGLNKMLTANCVPVRKGDNLATNGIVHVIDGVLHPITDDVISLIEEHPQLSNFRTVLKHSNLLKNVKADGHYTIFAPTDEAFNKLSEATRERLLRGDSCSGTIIKHHIVAHTVCSSAIVGNATTHSVDGELLNLQRTDEDVLLFENKAKIVKHDIMATNGVIHLIDDVIVPDSALYVTQSLKNENFTKFQALLEKIGLSDELDTYQNVTVFAPSDEAFSEPNSAKYLKEIQDNKEKLKEVVMYHIVNGQLESCEMNNNVMLKTKDNQNGLRLNLYSTLPIFSNIINRATVNCARLTGYDEKSCGSVIHEVNRILVPPTNNLLDEINTNERYSTLSLILKGTDVESILKDGAEALTVLAPTNEAFAKLDSVELDELKQDKRKASQLLKNHILTEVLCCSGVPRHAWGFNNLIGTLGKQPQSVATFGDDIRLGDANVVQCDNVATNGVIHSINKVLRQQQSRISTLQFLFF